jgi:hypothetical protein
MEKCFSHRRIDSGNLQQVGAKDPYLHLDIIVANRGCSDQFFWERWSRALCASDDYGYYGYFSEDRDGSFRPEGQNFVVAHWPGLLLKRLDGR